MTKEEFLEHVNRGRSPKYNLSDIHSGKPKKEGGYLVCTSTDKIVLARFQNGVWQQAHVITTGGRPSQYFEYTEIKDTVTWWK